MKLNTNCRLSDLIEVDVHQAKFVINTSPNNG